MTPDTLLATLNAKELLALLEENLLAQEALMGLVRDYTEPQLKRFRN